MKEKVKLIRMTTVPISMNIILKGQLSFINQFYEVIGVTGYDTKHFEECKNREGIRMQVVEMSRTISVFKDFQSLIKLFLFFKKEKPGIVHSHTPKAGLLGMLAAWLANVPVRLHTVGGMPLTETKGFKRMLLSAMERLTYACAHRIYPNSLGLLKIIQQENFCPNHKLHVLANGSSNGVNVDYFNPEALGNPEEVRTIWRSKMNVNPTALVFCFVGRIAREKGITELIEAFDQLRNTFREQEFKLLLIGLFEKMYGALTTDIQHIIRSHPDIIAPGRFDDVRPYYLLSDVYVFPSYREGFPNTLLEAGAMGLPIIATNINGCNEIVTEGVNGLLIAPKRSDELFQAMKKVIDPKFRKDMGQRSRMIIEEKFKRTILWDELLEQYDKYCLEKGL
ncbi:MAG: glycosyltransferase family 4 protein [Cyclobacteriaceae bacterium]|nr:glycosyltransferase family 4 protein [Cyclobacteriaceae bacterium]